MKCWEQSLGAVREMRVSGERPLPLGSPFSTSHPVCVCVCVCVCVVCVCERERERVSE